MNPLTLAATITLAGVQGRIDHLAVDIAHERLFLAALGNNTVEVIDVKAGKRIHTIPGLQEPQGLLYLADRNRLYVATGGDGACRIYDAADYKLRWLTSRLMPTRNRSAWRSPAPASS